ncbi:MAG TPA: c-type cytochrome [Thermoanaerobaculia bacterium]|jgi:mono/diheme cytochrome c family protein|nr:c-type cytochrome [Thermoanaerobaculia bacterium]
MATHRRNRRLVAGTVVFVVATSLALAGCDALFPKRSEGEKLWRDRCAQCHGVAGNGNTPQYMGNYNADLTDDSWTHGAEPGSWAVVIRQGVFGSMPANPDLSRQQVQALVDYLRELRGEKSRRPAG